MTFEDLLRELDEAVRADRTRIDPKAKLCRWCRLYYEACDNERDARECPNRLAARETASHD